MPSLHSVPIRSTALSIALCAVAYLYVSPYYPEINNPNENVRLYMTAAIVEEGRYEIDTFRRRWGWVNDAAKYEGRIYSVKAPGTSFLGIPGYAMAHHFFPSAGRHFALYLCRLTATVFPFLAFLSFFHRFLGRCTPSPVLRETVFFSVALGSLLYGYGLLFVSHSLAAASAFGAFMLLHRSAAIPDGWRSFVAGVLTASVTLFEYPGLVTSLALTGFAVYRLRHHLPSLALFAGGGALPTLAMMHFQHRAFGSPFKPGHLYVENASFRAAHHEGLYGAVGVSGEALYGLLLDLSAGLLPLTPILAFAVIGSLSQLRLRGHRAPTITALIVCIATTLGIASMNNWRGGWTLGPRYLATLVPFIAWLALLGLNKLHVRSPRLVETAAIACTVPALVLSGLLGAYYPHLPPDLIRPAATLLPALLDGGFAPFNALNLANTYGTPSIVPLWLCFGCVVVACGWRTRLTNALLGITLGALLTLAIARPDRPRDTRSTRAAAFIARHWSPAGFDKASILARKKRPLKPSSQSRLESLYRSQGRTRELKILRRSNPMP